jgi:NADH:ubiquinone oxidoreductase subunit C
MADADADPREDVHEVSDDTGGTDADAPAVPSDEVAAAVADKFAGSVFVESHGQPVMYVGRDVWHDVAQFLRDEQRFAQCVDVTAVDHLVDNERLPIEGVQPERYELVANYLSHARNRRIRVICEVPANDTEVTSILDLFPGVGFAEREVYDLFGITFPGHEDLARILMPDDWIGHPLRKDDSPARVPVTFKEDPSPR